MHMLFSRRGKFEVTQEMMQYAEAACIYGSCDCRPWHMMRVESATDWVTLCGRIERMYRGVYELIYCCQIDCWRWDAMWEVCRASLIASRYIHYSQRQTSCWVSCVDSDDRWSASSPPLQLTNDWPETTHLLYAIHENLIIRTSERRACI